jgi:hypothetical protein
MMFLDTVLKKTLSLALGWLPQLTQKAEARLVVDHAPIAGATHMGGDGSRYWVRVAVAPNHSPAALASSEFVDRASDLAKVLFGDMPFRIEYSGVDMVRIVADDGSSNNGPAGSTHVLSIFPSGLVVLQWVLEATPVTGVDGGVMLSLDDVVDALRRMYALAHSPQFAATHMRRRLVRRRLDWRVGLTAAVHGEKGPIHWRQLSSSSPLPDNAPTTQLPHCPFHEGYAAAAMSDRKLTDSLADTFRPALQDLFTSAGYSGRIAQAANAALTAPTWAPPLGTRTREITAG